jgi:hypothetical protein
MLKPVQASLPLEALADGAPSLLKIEREAGPGRLYTSAVLKVNLPAESARPLSRGLSLTRQVFPAGLDCSKQTCLPLDSDGKIPSARSGQKVTVRLTLSVPNDQYYIVVSDYIPAGAEILDTRLKTSQRLESGSPEAGATFDPQNPYCDGWGWWLFDEPAIYDDHITWSAESLPAGSYELTYTLVLLQPGKYQVLPAQASAMYFPEVQAASAGSMFVIK